MDELTSRLTCPQCGTGFRVELHRMRANVPARCPSCGFLCEISETQAIGAHRRLETAGYRERAVNPSSRYGSTTSREKRSEQ